MLVRLRVLREFRGLSCGRDVMRRNISGGATGIAAIPAPPSIPSYPSTVSIPDPLPEGVEPAFAELGLGGWAPTGMAQSCLEFFHVGIGLEWWSAIALGTVCVRAIVMPAVIMSQRNNANMTNNMPKMNHLQNKMNEAKQSGDNIASAKYGQEMMLFMKEKKINPLKNAIVPFVQFPFFISFFMGLRGMAHCPVDSMMTGGLLWFADLTVPDQFYALPVLTSLTLLANIELGVDGQRAGKMKLMKYVLRCLPLVMLPFTINFPSAILCYWLSSNLISLVQTGLFKLPKVRGFLKIPVVIKQAEQAGVPVKKKGFIKSVKEQFHTMKATREVQGRMRTDEIAFNKAGKGPLIKTYKYDPTKIVAAKPKQS